MSFNPTDTSAMLCRLAFLIAGLLVLPAEIVRSADGGPEGSHSASNNIYVIDLPVALQLAGARNLDLQMAKERLAESQAAYRGALWKFFPWLGVGVGYRRHDDLIQNVEGNILDVHKDSYSVGPSLTGQLDLGEAIYGKLAARQLLKASDYALESQR